MNTEPVRIINAIITTIGVLASAGAVAWLDESTAAMVTVLIVTWAAAFGVNATVTRSKVTPWSE